MNDADVIVIGGGAAGLMTAGTAALMGSRVLVVEKNERPARKVLITGKGRCNVTNNCTADEFLQHIPQNPRFLYSALSQFSPEDTMAFFEDRGVPLKTERGNRVFPCSDKAADIADALVRYAKESGAHILTGTVRSLVLKDGEVAGATLADGRELYAPAVVIATGGLSYPKTGSTGDGYRLAAQAGHGIVPPGASLVPIETQEPWCRDLMGLSLRNVTLSAYKQRQDAPVYKELGEMLFTHFGVSGPLVLSASAHIRELGKRSYTLSIDLKPGLSPEQLDARLLRDFAKYQNRDFINSLGDLLPRKLIPVIVSLSGIPYEQKVHQITRPMREKLVSLIKGLPLTVKGFRPVEEAIVTTGGVKVSEVNPKTMESKLTKGLYFAGEVLDVDGYTGGFNLQIAFSTGYAAGMHIGQ